MTTASVRWMTDFSLLSVVSFLLEQLVLFLIVKSDGTRKNNNQIHPLPHVHAFLVEKISPLKEPVYSCTAFQTKICHTLTSCGIHLMGVMVSICVPKNSYIKILTPPPKVTVLGGWSLHEWDQFLIKETPGRSVAPSTMTTQEGTEYDQEEGPCLTMLTP